MQKNTPKVWDQVWSDPGLVKQDKLILAAEEATIRWQRIKKTLEAEFGSLRGLKVLEIGSGIGTYGALLAKEGARVTLLDYSEKALERAKEFFANNNLKATRVAGDALHPPTQITKHKYDASISIGLTEHFLGKKRLQINKVHLDVLRKGGIAVIVVPNSYNVPYRIFKFFSEASGTWKFGEEYPYTRSELLALAPQLHAEFVTLFGDDLYTSLKFLLPANFLRRFFRVGSARNFAEIRKEKGTPLDNYFSYALALVLRKSS